MRISTTDLCILRADKGNKTVLMKMSHYEMKMNVLLSDTNTYKEIKKDLTLKIERLNNEWVKNLHIGGMMDTKTKYELMSHHSHCPRIYGLPKVHKPGLLLRPIVSCINSPTYNISKYLSLFIHKSLDHSKYNINNFYFF